MNYVRGYEFQELTQGCREGRRTTARRLSSWPLNASRVIRFQHQSNFWKPKWFLPRTALF